MKTTVSGFFIFFLLTFLPSHYLFGEKVFEIVTHENVLPHISSKNGISEGIDVDIIKELFRRLGLKYEIKHYPWKRAVKRVESGSSDMIFPAFKTEEREKFAVYPEVPIEIMRFTIFTRRDRMFKYEKAEDLKGKKIGLGRGYSAGPVFDEARKKGYFKVEETNSIKSDINKLMDGRIDCFVNQYTVARYYINEARLTDQIAEIENSLGKEIPTYIILSKKSGIKNIDTLSKNIGTALKTMWDDGTIENIISYYLEK